MYISNGNFLGKISQKDFGELLSQLDRRKRKNKIELVERDGIKKYAAEAKGNFEVTTPYENEQSYGSMCVFADNKQHFAYNKKFLDVFDNGENCVCQLKSAAFGARKVQHLHQHRLI